MVTMPSGMTVMKAFSASPSPPETAARTFGRWKSSSRPPPTSALAFRKTRREAPVRGAASGRTFVAMASALALVVRREPRRVFDGGADARVRAATADVAGHRRVDIGVGRLGIARQQRCRRHDLSGLAIAALHDIDREPCRLNLAAGWRRADAFYRRDRRLRDRGYRRHTGADGRAVDVHR